jgi:hypothetical protein
MTRCHDLGFLGDHQMMKSDEFFNIDKNAGLTDLRLSNKNGYHRA